MHCSICAVYNLYDFHPCDLVVFIESFTLFNLINTLLRIIISGVSSILLIIAIDKLIYRRKQ